MGAIGIAVRRWWRRVRYLVRARQMEADLAEEMRAHRELMARDLERQGLAADVTTRVRAFGNDALAINQARDVWFPPALQDISQDLRFAVRMLAKDRRFTVAAVIALALGIGVNNSVFAIINAALIKDAPFDDAERLISIRSIDARGRQAGVSLAEFRDLSAQSSGFEGLGADASGPINLSADGLAPERLRGAYLSASTLTLLRTRPVLGRPFVEDDDRPGASPVVILGHGAWLRRYGGDPSVVGRTVKVNGTPAVIIGVMPPGFRYPFIAETSRRWGSR